MRLCRWLFLGWILGVSAWGSTEYSVHKGDTLFRISRNFRIPVEQIIAANHGRVSAPAHLKVGQKILIPGPARPSVSPKQNLPQEAVPYVDRHKPTPRHSPDERTAASGSDKRKDSPSYLFINRIIDRLNAPTVKPGRWKYVVVHHSGTQSGNARIFDYFHRHVRGMENGLAYHFVIGNGRDSGDGEIEIGNRWMRQIKGGHVHSDYLNEVSLGICFVGDFNRDRPTKKQIAAALELIGYLNRRCGTAPIFKLHREINPRPTNCPGNNFPGKAFHQLFDQ
jgi:LysM repeat protein